MRVFATSCAFKRGPVPKTIRNAWLFGAALAHQIDQQVGCSSPGMRCWLCPFAVNRNRRTERIGGDTGVSAAVAPKWFRSPAVAQSTEDGDEQPRRRSRAERGRAPAFCRADGPSSPTPMSSAMPAASGSCGATLPRAAPSTLLLWWHRHDNDLALLRSTCSPCPSST
jgi:hypothetical protein